MRQLFFSCYYYCCCCRLLLFSPIDFHFHLEFSIYWGCDDVDVVVPTAVVVCNVMVDNPHYGMGSQWQSNAAVHFFNDQYIHTYTLTNYGHNGEENLLKVTRILFFCSLAEWLAGWLAHILNKWLTESRKDLCQSGCLCGMYFILPGNDFSVHLFTETSCWQSYADTSKKTHMRNRKWSL